MQTPSQITVWRSGSNYFAQDDKANTVANGMTREAAMLLGEAPDMLRALRAVIRADVYINERPQALALARAIVAAIEDAM